MQLSEKSNNILLLFYYIFVIYIKLSIFSSQKKEPHSSSISRIIDSDRRGYLSVKKILFLKTLP